MKKYFYLLSAMLVSLFSSCKKEGTLNSNPDGVSNRMLTFNCNLVPESRVKTSLNGIDVKWSDGDAIKVYNEYGNAAIFTMSGHNDDYSFARFSGDILATDHFYSLYPEGSASSISGSDISFTMSQEQPYAPSSFASGIVPLVASTTDENLNFKQVFGLLKVGVMGTGSVTKVELTDIGGSPLWGLFSVDASASNPVATYISGGTPTITQTMTTAIELSANAPTYFYFALPEGSLGNGFCIALTSQDGKIAYKEAIASDKNKIKRGELKELQPFIADFQPVYILDQTVDNEPLLTQLLGQTVHVQLKRSIIADGGYYSLCLPFALDERIKSQYFFQSKLLQVTDVTFNTTKKTYSVTLDNIDYVEAGIPFFLKLQYNLNNAIFYNVKIDACTGGSIETDRFSHRGIFKPTLFYKQDYKIIFLYTATTFRYPSVTGYTNSFRSYIYLYFLE